MLVDCPTCVDGTLEGGGTCTVCGGDGEIDLTDDAFKKIRASHRRLVDGVVLSAILEELDYIHGKVTAIWNAVKPGK